MKRSFTCTFVGAVATASLAAVGHAGTANGGPDTVQGGSFGVETSHTRVQFAVSHMGFSNWFGDFTGVAGTLDLDPGKIEASKVDITIPIASLSTTNTKLDGELKAPEWLDAERFPTIRFVSDKVIRTGPQRASVAGTLTFHGVSRAVVLDAQFNAAGTNPMTKAYTVGFDATTSLNRSDFGVKTYVPMIGDKVDLRISAAFERKG